MAPKRIAELDVLRGIAILLVMGVHVPAYPIWSTIGGLGVDLFFVLSGFLISNLLFTEYRNTGAIQLKRFYLRRALKLYPSFYLLLALTMVYCVALKLPFTANQVVGELILTQNYVGSLWGHTWSLAVEEHFYILLPILLWYLMGKRPGAADPFRAIPVVFGVVAVLCLGLRILNAAQHPVYHHQVHYGPSHLRFDSLLFGVLLSYLHNFRPSILITVTGSKWRFYVALLSVLAISPAMFLPPTDPFIYTVGFTLIYIFFGTMLILSIYKETDRKRGKPGKLVEGLAKMGAYSYTLYLWHVPLAQVFAALANWFPNVNPYLLHAIYFAISIVVGVAASKLVERPVLALRERLLPVTQSAVAEVGVAGRLTAA